MLPLILGATACFVGGASERLVEDETGDGAQTETGEMAEPGLCGNGFLDPGESCDLGPQNDDAGDCTSECRWQSCGDGHEAKLEPCDDGNKLDGDGCSAQCELESCGNGEVDPGEDCDDGNSSDVDDCASTCLEPYCGDGHVWTRVEQCDDQNFDNGDDCTTSCELAQCGDGYVHIGAETCDDGNLIDDDGCTSACEPATCGDGIVEAGVEECDDANAVQTDDCLGDCANAKCGDGHVWFGVEQCDDGDLANDDACVGDCEPASCGDGYTRLGIEECDDGNDDDNDACLGECVEASCGDGFVRAGVEECDDANAMPGDGCDANCIDEHKVVFVTSATYNGNLGGIEGADAKCQALADDVGLQGTFLAWLSADQSTPASRFAQSTKPYKTVTGVQIADNWPDLIDGSLDAPINVTQLGGGGVVSSVWTATNTNGGAYSDENCAGWFSALFSSGNLGSSSQTSSSWTRNYSSSQCSSANRIYCFEQ